MTYNDQCDAEFQTAMIAKRAAETWSDVQARYKRLADGVCQSGGLTPPPAQTFSLEEQMDRVQNALDCCAIDVTIWEIGDDPHRPTESSDSLHRLTKCLRSHGVLDEYTTEEGK